MPPRSAITYIGGPTALLEIGGIRLLTDPTLDAPGQHYNFGFGTGSTKTQGPALSLEELGRIDAVLLTHDQHQDNLDTLGRDALARADRVLTTTAAAGRLGHGATGLQAWESATVAGADGLRVSVTATPSRHGAMGTSLVSGPTIGFLLEWEGQENGALYISGDTVFFPGIPEVGRRFKVAVAVIHFGGVRFPISGPARYTFDAADGLRAATTVGARTVVPIHFEGWSHFRTPREEIEKTFALAGKADLLRWPVLGQAVKLDL